MTRIESKNYLVIAIEHKKCMDFFKFLGFFSEAELFLNWSFITILKFSHS